MSLDRATSARAANDPAVDGSAADGSAVDDRAADDRAAAVQQLRELVDRTRPVSLAEQRVLPILPAVEALLGTGLRRGSVLQVGGGVGVTSLALALAAGPTRAGSWVACVGLPELGWAAAVEAGVDLERLVVVRPTESSWATVVAALVDAFDVVLCGLERAPSAAEVRRLQARARERGSVLIVVGSHAGVAGRARRAWPEAPEVELTVVGSEWSGLGRGWGTLGARRVTVEVGGRRGMGQRRRVELWLPAADGRPAAITPSGSIAPASPIAVPEQPELPDRAQGGAVVTPIRRAG